MTNPVPDHVLKIWPDPFRDVVRRLKLAEYRRDDREPRFKAGQVVELVEFDPEAQLRTGRWVTVGLTHVTRGPHIPPGWAMFSFELLSIGDAPRPPRPDNELGRGA